MHNPRNWRHRGGGGMIFSPIQLAFIKFLKACIAKNKKYGYINLTNKQIAERFEFKQRKYSESRIKTLLFETKEYFHFENQGKARQIFSSKLDCITIRTSYKLDCITIRTSYKLDCNTIATSYKLDSNTIKPRQETLEPQGLQDPLLIDKINFKNKDQDKDQDKEEKVNQKENVANATPRQEKNLVEKKIKFIQPLESEVSTYFINEKALKIQEADEMAQNFMNYYESIGWKVGKNKMQSWKSAASGWLNRQKKWDSERRQRNPRSNNVIDLDFEERAQDSAKRVTEYMRALGI